MFRVLFHGARIDNQIVQLIEHEIALEIGKQFIHHSTQNLAADAYAHGQFFKLEEAKMCAKGSNATAAGGE